MKTEHEKLAALKAVLDGIKRNTALVVDSSKVTEIARKIQEAEAFDSRLFGVEADARPTLHDKIFVLRTEENRFKKVYKEKYPWVSREPLQWRDNKDYPKLAIFQLRHQAFIIHSALLLFSLEGIDGIRLPEELEYCYRDVQDKLKKLPGNLLLKKLIVYLLAIAVIAIALFLVTDNSIIFNLMALGGFIMFVVVMLSRNREYFITARYGGIILDKTRQKILEAQEDSGKYNIYILAEVRDWKKSGVYEDPLVLGFADGEFWLIDSYDTTPKEEYIKREFTARKEERVFCKI